MNIREIIIGVVLVAAIVALLWLVRDSQKKGAKVCGKMCGGCPHPCNNDGTPKEEAQAGDGEQ